MRLFLSYAHEDRARVNSVAAALAGTGHAVEFDRDLRSGQRYRTWISERIDAADAVVVFWTPFSVVSEWVCDEAEHARSLGTLRPIAIGAAPPIGFRQRQTPQVLPDAGPDEIVAALGLDGSGPAVSRPPAAKHRPDDIFARRGPVGRLASWLSGQ